MKGKIRKYISVFVLSVLLLAAGCGDPPMPTSDAEIMLCEWGIREADRSKIVADESRYKEYEGVENPENFVTWRYECGFILIVNKKAWKL